MTKTKKTKPTETRLVRTAQLAIVTGTLDGTAPRFCEDWPGLVAGASLSRAGT